MIFSRRFTQQLLDLLQFLIILDRAWTQYFLSLTKKL